MSRLVILEFCTLLYLKTSARNTALEGCHVIKPLIRQSYVPFQVNVFKAMMRKLSWSCSWEHFPSDEGQGALMESLAGRKAESVLSCPAFRRQQEIFSQSRPEQEQPVYVYVYIYIYI